MSRFIKVKVPTLTPQNTVSQPLETILTAYAFVLTTPIQSRVEQVGSEYCSNMDPILRSK